MKTKIPFFAALMLAASVAPALANLNPTRAYDLSVEYFIGMPSWQAAGDPHFQMWMTHTPKGTAPLRPVAIPYREVD